MCYSWSTRLEVTAHRTKTSISRLKTFLHLPGTQACSLSLSCSVNRENHCSSCFAVSPLLCASGYQLSCRAEVFCSIDIHICSCSEMRLPFELSCSIQQRMPYPLRLPGHVPLLHQGFPPLSLNVQIVKGQWLTATVMKLPTFLSICHLHTLLVFLLRLQGELN